MDIPKRGSLAEVLLGDEEARKVLIQHTMESEDSALIRGLFSRMRKLAQQGQHELVDSFKELYPPSPNIGTAIIDRWGNTIATHLAISNNYDLFQFYLPGMEAIFHEGELKDSSGNTLLNTNIFNLLEDDQDLRLARFLADFEFSFEPNEAGLDVLRVMHDICMIEPENPELVKFHHEIIMPRIAARPAAEFKAEGENFLALLTAATEEALQENPARQAENAGLQNPAAKRVKPGNQHEHG